MENITLETPEMTQLGSVISPKAMLAHWQGHRKVTRRVIEAFPEDKLFTYSIGGMRPFSELAMEMICMGAPGIRGVVTGTWQTMDEVAKIYKTPKTKNELLQLWDKATDQINSLWPHIKAQRFLEVDKVFGQYEGPISSSIFYFVDNEIHHRGQGYVYLRSLGIEPPAFWDR